jgi:hypothetical protein
LLLNPTHRGKKGEHVNRESPAMKHLIRLDLLLFSLLILLPALASAQTQPDTLTTRDGSTIQGSFRAATSEHVVLEIDSDSGLDVTIPWKSIQRIKLGQRIHVQGLHLTGADWLPFEPQTTLTPSSNRLLTITSGQRTKTESLSKIELITVQANTVNLAAAGSRATGCLPAEKPIWYASVTPKFSLAEGTQSVQTISGSAAVRRSQNVSCETWQHQATTLTLDANNSLTEQVGSSSIRTHEYDGSLSHQVYLAGGLYAEGLAEGFHNSSFNLYLQQSYGVGFGGRVLANKTAVLELGGGALYVAEHFTGSSGPSFAAGRLTDRLYIRLADLPGGALSLSESTSYLPAIDQAKAWQVRGTVQLVVPITKRLSFTTGFLDDYMENAPNARKNYSTTTAGISFSLGQD